VKKILLAVASLALVASPVVASAQSYGHGRDGGGWNGHSSQERTYDRGQARGDYGRSYDQRGRSDNGQSYRDSDRNDSSGAVFAGIAGLLLGSALSSSQSDGYSQSYGYSQPYDYSPAYSQRCGWQNQAYEDGYGNVEYRQVEVCR
jgi:hypothetical protein